MLGERVGVLNFLLKGLGIGGLFFIIQQLAAGLQMKEKLHYHLRVISFR